MTENPETGNKGGAGALLRGSRDNIATGIALLRRAPRATAALQARAFTPGRMAVGAVIVLAAAIWQMVLFDATLAAGARELPRWIATLFRGLTDFGKSGWFLWPIGIVLTGMAVRCAFDLPRVCRLVLASLAVRLMYVFLAIGVPGLFVTIVKRMIGRARPSLTEVAGDPFSYAPFAWKAAYAGMPSGHATTAFAAALAIGALWPRSRWIMWLYAGAIAASRVIVSAHYLSDVIVGAAVGLFGALLVRHYFAARGLAFAATPHGEIYPMPGPSLRRLKRVAHAVAGQ